MTRAENFAVLQFEGAKTQLHQSTSIELIMCFAVTPFIAFIASLSRHQHVLLRLVVILILSAAWAFSLHLGLAFNRHIDHAAAAFTTFVMGAFVLRIGCFAPSGACSAGKDIPVFRRKDSKEKH